MLPSVQPDPQTVYRDAKGDPLLYVRTEQRPGAPAPEHLFVKAYNRVCLQVWAKEVPEGAVLVIDAGGRKQANEERWLRLAAEHNVEILAGLLKRACQWLPRERAQELRQRYVEAQP
jgi:predicted kinase